MNKNHENIILIGYIGKDNFGDDMMMEAVQHMVGDAHVDCIHARTDFLHVIKLLWRAKRVIVCGGNIVDKNHGSYIRVLTAAWLMRCPISFVSIEVTDWPVKPSLAFLQRRLFNFANVSVRTITSALLINERLPSKFVPCIVDLFYLHAGLKLKPIGTSFGRFHLVKDEAANENEMFVLPRSFPNHNSSYSDAKNIERFISEISRILEETNVSKIIVSASANVDSEVAYYDAVKGEFGSRVSVVSLGIDETINLSEGTTVISNRLHIAKLCAIWNVRSTLISYSNKTECPEICGSNGQVLDLGGKVRPYSDFSLSKTELNARIASSTRVVEKQVKP
jgi:polysaccharide pyruvyl transferase WcaK-like protein